MNAAIEWVNEVKDVITIAVTAVIQQKDNKHALALTEMRTANKCNLQKYCKRLPPSERESTDSSSDRTIKETTATTKVEEAETTSTEAEVAETKTPAAKTTTTPEIQRVAT